MTDTLKEELHVLQEPVTIRENSEILLYSLVNVLSKVIHYCHQKNIPIENETPLSIMLHDTRKLLQNLQQVSPTKNQQPNKTPGYSTESKNYYNYCPLGTKIHDRALIL
jgi:hypothetical protein